MDLSRNYILASGSPRRIDMMRERGIEPLIFPADIAENLPVAGGMCETVQFLALKKAQWVEQKYMEALSGDCPELQEKLAQHGFSAEGEGGRPPIIIAADTIVYKDEVMGKPLDKADGFRMLDKLRNDVHYVVTGVALIEAGAQNARVFAEVTRVYFKDYTDEELNAYLDTDEAYDKAGGYAIQGYFARYIDHFEGYYDNVVGFPWARIQAELSKL